MSFLTPAENLPLLRFNDLVIRTATLDDMNSIYTMGYDAWGDGLELNKHLFFCNNSEKYKKGTWYILEERNCILSSIICYSLPSIYDISTIGIGSLSTVSDKRRNGFARILLDAVKKEYRNQFKTRVFILYSDINPDYYKISGFEPLPDFLQKKKDTTCMVNCNDIDMETIIKNFRKNAPLYF